MNKRRFIAKIGVGFYLLCGIHGGVAKGLEISLGGELTVLSPLQLTSTTNRAVTLETGPARVQMSQIAQDKSGTNLLALVVGRDEFRFYVRKSDIFGGTLFESRWSFQDVRGQITGVMKTETLSADAPRLVVEPCRYLVAIVQHSPIYRWGEVRSMVQDRVQKKHWRLDFMVARHRMAHFTTESYEERNILELSRSECR